MINRWTGIGRLVKDPENRYTPNGVSVTTFTILKNNQIMDNNANEGRG